ncbi:hypothetical protein MSAN_01191000 [Mycena sanguinolenta]|uniref:F-box domain-containing protein n=1 Tax=Mycena sanguinolenta TaxID=230812 RepID=A0A8H7D4W7_9AGAR|nr:hypothetical protein MSAN_01191000 [Mycena sanguinolenta]
MVLIQRAHQESMEISQWLPNEVLLHIIEHSPKADQATLSSISKLFRGLCLPVLYRVVKIKGYHAMKSFCSGTIENPSRGDSVRSFTLDVPYSSSHIEGHSALILAALKLMPKLEHLSVSESILDTHHGHLLLEQGSFPQLISCNLWVPSDALDGFPAKPSDLGVAFLARHSTLKRVHLHSEDEMVPPQPVRISLPNLELYEGNAAFILAIDAIALKRGPTFLAFPG